MTVHEVMNEVAERGWFSAEQKKLYGTEMGMALLSESAGFRPAATPEEIFAEVAGLGRSVRAYYSWRFRNALRSQRQEVAEFAQALEAAA